MRISEKYRWPAAFTLLIAFGLTFAFWPRPLPVEVETVSSGPMTVTVDDDAVTRIREVFTVTTPFSGRILRIDKHAGDDVIAGETVLYSILPISSGFLDPRTRKQLEAALAAAEDVRDAAKSRVEGAQAALDHARTEFKRSSELLKKGAGTESSLDQAQRELRMAEADLATNKSILLQREAELNQARAALLTPLDTDKDHRDRGLEIKASESGKVLRVFQESESTVTAGVPLMEIGNPSDLEIAADLLSREALRISPGDTVSIENWGGEGTLNGRVRLIEPAGTMKVSSLGIEEQRVNVIIDITDPGEKWASLGHGYQVDVRVAVWHGESVLRVSIGSLFRRGESWAVFRIEDGHARLQTIKVGHMSSKYAEVLGGLAEGDKVVAYPSDRVGDGALVSLSNP